MFDEHAKKLIDLLPALPGLDRDACRRALSAAYFHVVQSRLAVAGGAADLAEVRALLRRLVDALESVAVFDRLAGVETSEATEAASAFVAAEALSLLASLPAEAAGEAEMDSDQDTEQDEPPEPMLVKADSIQRPDVYLRFEAALLYFIAGYEINALALVTDVEIEPRLDSNTVNGARRANARHLVLRLRDFCTGRVGSPAGPPPFIGYDAAPADYEDIVDEARLWIYHDLASAITAYMQWLGGFSDTLANAKKIVAKVREATASPVSDGTAETSVLDSLGTGAEFADMYHLASLLAAAFERTSARSFFHTLPRPSGGDESYAGEFEKYCAHRVRGDARERARPFLWPTAVEFVEKMLPDLKADAVVTMPTGSGKSSLAEIAIVHALARGDVIYLAPTNALVHQIRRDLEHALRPFGEVEVLAFVGSGEYTRLAEETMTVSSKRFVGVMTPEKCALALRLTPEVLAECALCIFDECHLLNDADRGVTADLLLAQLFQAAPQMRVVLMSAMIGNAGELAAWLKTTRGVESYQTEIKWRPSRALRGLAVVNREPAIQAFRIARADLLARVAAKQRRKNVSFDSELALIAGLSGPWTKDGPLDYRSVGVGVTIEAQASLPQKKLNGFLSQEMEALQKADGNLVIPNFASWKNLAGRLLAERLARVGIPTINFILSSRHHAFSCAFGVETSLPGSIAAGASFPPLVESWLALADAELGQPTALRGLLARGVAVHTSAMLQVEQAASEWMFTQKMAALMFATGTLAQGLNLPAVAVVISGTSMGDPRDTDKVVGIGQRAEAMILNGFGRAGRPGFSNQGLAVLVSDKPFSASIKSRLDASGALTHYPVLGMIDAAVNIGSPIEQFIDQLAVEGGDITTIREQELELVTQLVESPEDGDHAGEVLRRTFGGYRKRAIFDDAMSRRLRDRIIAIRKEYFEQAGMPPWLNRAAMEAGVDFFRAQRMWAAWQERGLVAHEDAADRSVAGWRKVFFEVIRRLPPTRVTGYMADEETKTASALTRLRDSSKPFQGIDTVPWQQPPEWQGIWDELEVLTEMWMNGNSFTAIAMAFCELESVPSDRSSGKPLPTIFGVVRNLYEPLARDAGCFVSLIEHQWKHELGDEVTIPEALEALSIALRAGCDTLESLAWYRFGYRQRHAAHLLSDVFPVPTTLKTDSERAQWVRDMRKSWMAGDVDLSSVDPLLEHIRTIMQQSAE